MKHFDMMMIMKAYARELNYRSKDSDVSYKFLNEQNRLAVKRVVKGKKGGRIIARVSTKEFNNWEVKIGNKTGVNGKLAAQLAAQLADKMADYAYTPLNER